MKNYFLNTKKELKKIKSLVSRKITNLGFFYKIDEKIYLFKKFKRDFFKVKNIKFFEKFELKKGLPKVNLKKEIKDIFISINFNELKKINPENAILYFFFSIGLLTSFVTLLTVSRPLNKNNLKILEQIKVSRVKKNNINKLSLNLIELKKIKEKNNKDTVFLINLIGGTQNLDTFTASLNKIALENKVTINSFEPKEIKKPGGSNPNKNELSDQSEIINKTVNLKENLNIPKEDLMLVPELEKHIIEITVNADFIKVLKFIKDLELLENIVLIDDFDIVRIEDILTNSKSEINYSTTLSAFGRIKNIVDEKIEIRIK